MWRPPAIVGECDSPATAIELDAAASIALARPKSSTLTRPSRGDLDVGRLQIAMDDAALVRGVERVGNLPGDRQRLGDRHAREAAAWLSMISASVCPSTSSRTSA